MKTVRIGLLDQYTGENLGDAAILEAALHAVRLRRPDAEAVLITLYPGGAEARHDTSSYPMTGLQVRWYSSSPAEYARRTGLAPASSAASQSTARASGGLKAWLKRSPRVFVAIKRAHQILVEPFLHPLRRIASHAVNLCNELRHIVRSWRMLKDFDVIIVAGGGQIDDDFGGPWGHPYSLMKWAVLASLTRTRFVVLSVGVCSLNYRLSEIFFGQALRRAEYRSYRDNRSRKLVADLYGFASEDPVVPDLAFSHPRRSAWRPSGGLGARCRIGVSPIVYLSSRWPKRDAGAFTRYLDQLTAVVVRLVEHGHLVSLFQSDDNDTPVVNELAARASAQLAPELRDALRVVHVASLEALFAELESLECLLASRLHGILLAHLMERPVVAISYDPKVTSHMEYMRQADFCLNFMDFTASAAIERLQAALSDSERQLKLIREQNFAFQAMLQAQFDRILGEPRTARSAEGSLGHALVGRPLPPV